MSSLRLRLPNSAALIRTLRASTPGYVIAAAAIGGVCGAGAMVVLTLAPQRISEGTSLFPLALLFLVFLFGYRMTDRAVMEMGLIAVQAALHRTRNRIAGKVARLDLRDMETLSREEQIGAMAQAYATISDVAMPVLGAAQSAVMMVLVLAYLAWLSPAALVLSLMVAALSARSYMAEHRALGDAMGKTGAAETALRGKLGEMLDGFKELRLDQVKRRQILAELRAGSMISAKQRSRVAGIFTEMLVVGKSTEYLLAAAVVFALPALGITEAADIPTMLSAVLFLMGPLGNVVASLPQVTTLRFAVNSVQAFEDQVDTLMARHPNGQPVPAGRPVVSMPRLQGIELQGVTYAHTVRDGQPRFEVGPLDFRIEPGEIVFVTGSNGAGKTTGLRLITGLYPPQSGQLLLNGSPVMPADLEAYRHLFGTVFADFHTFRKPYGIAPDRLPVLHQALRRMQIDRKLPANIAAGYDPTALSTGQRKRLALALTIAEDRPILVFDEWAADQDPEFRRSFYREVLPDLRQAGKAIIAVSHDDRYFDLADRRYHMADRRMTLVSDS